jgi:hypothetical protein
MVFFSVLVDMDSVNATAAYRRTHACTTGRYAAIAQKKNYICSFSQAQDCSLMMAPAESKHVGASVITFKMFLTFLPIYNCVHQLE